MAVIKLVAEGTVAIVCGVGRTAKPAPCAHCAKVHTKLCDWPVEKDKTCDKKLCDEHAHNVGPDRDYCPEHHQIIINQGDRK